MPNLQRDDDELAHQNLQTLRKNTIITHIFLATEVERKCDGGGRYQPVQASVQIVGL